MPDDAQPATGRLVLAATPIGDPADAPPRLAALLGSADLVLAEDTRRLRRLAAALGVEPSGRLLRSDEHTEQERTATVVEAVRSGATVLLVTDAGMPSVSDPGLRSVRAVVEAGLPVTAVPGPSAVLTALALSGLPTDRFCFDGFLPRKEGERRRALLALVAEPRTVVLFEAPHRLRVTLATAVDVLGPDRRGAICRELTKTYEEVVRGTLAELLAWAQAAEVGDGVRGEITLVLAGAEPVAPPTEAELPALVEQVLARAAAGERLKDAAREVAARSGAATRDLYDAAARARHRPPAP